MKIGIVSNFVIPGLEVQSEIDVYNQTVTLRTVLEHLLLKSSGRVHFIRPGKDIVDPDDFILEINGLPIEGLKEDLDIVLKEGDTVTIKLSPLGGG
jgi:PDZ domain-containing secreted protein